MILPENNLVFRPKMARSGYLVIGLAAPYAMLCQLKLELRSRAVVLSPCFSRPLRNGLPTKVGTQNEGLSHSGSQRYIFGFGLVADFVCARLVFDSDVHANGAAFVGGRDSDIEPERNAPVIDVDPVL